MPETIASMTESLLKNFNDAMATGKDLDKQKELIGEFVNNVKSTGVALSFTEGKINDLLSENMAKGGKKGGAQRGAAVNAITELCTLPGAAVFLLPILSKVMELQGDKVKFVQKAAKTASDAIYKQCDETLVNKVLSQLLVSLHSHQGNTDRFTKISELCIASPEHVSTDLRKALSSTIPQVSALKKEVSDAAQKALRSLCETCSNPDMKPFLPPLIEAIKDQKKIPDTVFKMASTTFVAEVEGSTLAIMAPVLQKGLSTKSTMSVKRQCSRIIENMSKLVDEPRFLTDFAPEILPLLKKAKDTVSDPECRDVCEKGFNMLTKKFGQAKALNFDIKVATTTVEAAAKEVLPALASKAEFAPVLSTVADLCSCLNEVKDYDAKSWIGSVGKVLIDCAGVSSDDAATFCEKVRVVAEASRDEVVEDEMDQGVEVLTDLPFGLAYGNKVLLRKTKLRLYRGYKYGLVGQNDSGKTSLLRALADYKIEGFPAADVCRTVFVATDIDSALADMTVVEYMLNDALLKETGAKEEDMVRILTSVGFKEGAAASPTQKVGTLSGGWRMKLALCRAMLLKADILLLDEPTNHLDAFNVKWVETYLLSLTNVTCIMVSHDSGLLTRVCNRMIEIEDMKLNYFNGNLDEFVKAKPEAKCYFELAKEGKIDFKFPNPGLLPGVKSKGKAILKMTDITFTYPGVAKPQLNNVTIQVSLSSRVACVGENGAGKSTMIKLLTGELEPDEGSGSVWKHPNCRVGYIAQHAFHHIEKHLDKSANDYIRWRYENGGDKEETVKVTSISTEEELKQMEKPIEMKFPQEDGSIRKAKYKVHRFTELRRDVTKGLKTQEYEVVIDPAANAKHWVERDLLIKSGFEKVLKVLDERIALRATTFARPLTKGNVEKHIADVGLAAEFSTHMRMGALSGGQKVKVVLASALWSKPHILILDEPTNYLDRESLGALARAIRAFEGGVVMITHNSQFCDNLCPVVWHLQNNTLDVKGDAEWMAEAAREAIKVDVIDEKDMVDKFGNTIELKKKKKKKSRSELKAKKQRRLKRFKETGDNYDSSEDDW